MNGLLILVFVIGCLGLAVACLKTLDTGPTIGPAYSPAARVMVLLIVFLAVYAALEAGAARYEMRCGQSLLMLIVGAFSVWRTFAPPWASFLERIWVHRDHPPPVVPPVV